MLDDKIKVIQALNDDFNISQRKLAKKVNMSLGKVNKILHEFTEENFIERAIINNKILYKVTEKGMKFLEKEILCSKDSRINLHEKNKKVVKEAVILAAGKTKCFDIPIGLLEVQDTCIINRIIDILKDSGINKIVIVTGYKSSLYEKKFKDYNNIKIVKNDLYKWTGTMYSLSLAKKYIDDDFLLIENDLIFEKRAIKDLVEDENRDSILITSESGSGDEAFVEIKNNHLFKMSKDIHQFNKIDGEMIGITKISLKLYKMMLEEYKDNVNPYLNYEYMLLDVSRDYNIGYIKIDDLIWCDADGEDKYEKIKDFLYPTIKRREKSYEIDTIKKIMINAFNIKNSENILISPAGGMTNLNYKVKADNKEYILRIPGAGTDEIIDRKNEMFNSAIASEKGFNVGIKYFNVETGIKISDYINNAETLTTRSLKKEENLFKILKILKSLHNSRDFHMGNEFNVFSEIKKYEDIIRKNKMPYYNGYNKLSPIIDKFKNIVENIGVKKVPCHNDLVSENIIRDSDGRIYLIDWEYSGFNDKMWDLAELSLENEFSDDDNELMFIIYFDKKGISNQDKTKFNIYKILQDILWSLWTIIKESEGVDFGDYGIKRLRRAAMNINKIIE
ncbi:phosphotransferase [Clostridium sp. BJN0001]|uniref:phosphotransferase n=1 Tax=Clostridium sp. BJN0001 TaxID=2930219 RepID=UPI001FD2F7CA|nr:phosphotransferase [Clostridium sp. BJN0001]